MSGLYINEDAWCFFANRAVAPWHCPDTVPMNLEGLRRQVDYYAVPGVTAIVFNGNAMQPFFDSRSAGALWDGMTEDADGRLFFRGREIEGARDNAEDLATLCRNARELFANVPDPYRARYGLCRERGVGMYLSMRMNDVHYVDDPERIMHAALWRDRPETRRAHYRNAYAFWFSECFDYSHEAVRQRHLDLAAEYLERFEMDGFELDWMRSPFHFRPGGEEAGRALLTEFMREIRQRADAAAKRWGHPVRIVVRVPAQPEEALYAGLDVFAWADAGLINMAVPSPYYRTSEAALPVALWRRLLPPEVEVSPCLEQHVGDYAGMRMRADAEIDAGFATAYFHRGADSIYLFNHMFKDGYADRRQQREAYRWLGDPGAAAAKPRRHLATGHEGIIEGTTNRAAFHDHIPPGGYLMIRVEAGFATAGRAGRIVLGFAADPAPAELEVRLNAAVCPHDRDAGLPELPPGEWRFHAFAVPDGVLHDGGNLVEVRNLSAVEIQLKWVEIDLAGA